MIAWVVVGLLAAVGTPAQSSPEGPASSPATQESAALTAPPSALVVARLSVEKYFAQATNVVCAESVTQAIVGRNGKAAYREESMFDYQLQASTNSGSLKLVESRETRKASFRDAARTLLITNGFASMLLVVHPEYENSYTFESAGEETSDGVTLSKIHFKPIPGGTSPAALQLRGQSYPIPLSGTLWIDPQTGSVAKLIASVDGSLTDLGLQSMRSEIHYGMIQFHDPDENYWMPVSATIDVETPKQHWRNIHRFNTYKRFRASIEVEAENKK
jgi:hypothetical protein